VGEAYRQKGLAFQERDPGFGNAADADELQPMATLEHVKLIVVRYGPESSRPSSGRRRAFHGRFYDVWAREGDPQILAHRRFGTSVSAAAPATCDELSPLAAQAREAGARLAFAPRPEAVAMVTGTRPHPANWPVSPGSPEDLVQIGPGKVSGPVTTEAGRFDVWLRGSVERAVHIRVDGREVGVARSAISPRRSPIHVGTVTLEGGEHTVDVVVGGGSLAPGDGGIDRLVGPVALTPAGDPTNVPVQTVPADQWRSLCGRSLDWAEVVG
jgi:hypothetical protein